MALGAAKHKRKKIERLLYPPRISAPWLGPVIKMSPGRGRGHKYGNMHFTIYRREEHPIGPGPLQLAKLPYSAKVCIGRPGSEKPRRQGCEWGSGRTPTKALARATSNLGRRLAKLTRGK